MEENEETTYDNGHFYMPVVDIFYISGRGYVFTGYIESGTVTNGDEVVLSNGMKSTVSGIEMFNKLFKKATKGDSVGLLLSGIKKGELKNTENLIIEKEDGIEYTPEPEIQQDQGHFSMPVNDLFTISGRGYVFSGTIQSGTVHMGDEVTLSNGLKSYVNGIEIGRDFVDWATKGETAGLLLGSISTKTPIDTTGLTVEGIDTERSHCEISVTEQSPVKGNGINVKGKILSGTINVGDPIIYAEPDDGIFQTATVDAIETDGENVQSAKQGQIVTLNFQGLTMRAKFDKVIKR